MSLGTGSTVCIQPNPNYLISVGAQTVEAEFWLVVLQSVCRMSATIYIIEHTVFADGLRGT